MSAAEATKSRLAYIDWMRVCSDITVTGLPAISVPAGFTPDGLPVGLQIVGRHQDEWGVLQLAHAFEGATGFGRRPPGMVRSEFHDHLQPGRRIQQEPSIPPAFTPTLPPLAGRGRTLGHERYLFASRRVQPAGF